MMKPEPGLNDLFVAHATHLRNYMLKLTRDREDAADLVQETFLRLCQQDRLPPYPRTWLARTGYRLFVDEWRRKRRARGRMVTPNPVGCTMPEQAYLERELEDEVDRLLQRLHPRARDAFRLRVRGSLSYGDIAQLLGCSENAIKSCMRRGRVHLAQWLSDVAAPRKVERAE